MPVQFKLIQFKENLRDEILNLNVDAIVVPRMISDEQIPKITQYVYSLADEKKIAAMYAYSKGKTHKTETDLAKGCNLDENGLPSPTDLPNITVTSGCGLKVEHIFHVCVEPYVVYRSQEPYYPDLPEEYYDIIPRSELFPLREIDTEYIPTESEMKHTLTRCYETVLNCAKEKKVRSIAFIMLGAEDTSCYPYALAHLVAHTEPEKWLRQHTEVLPLSTEEENHSAFLKLVKMQNEKNYSSAKVQLECSRSEMVIKIIEPPSEFIRREQPEKAPDDPRIKYINLENRLEKEIKSSGKTRKVFAREFILKCFNESEVNCNQIKEITGYNPNKLKNGRVKSPSLRHVITTAVMLRLEKYERFAFIRSTKWTDYPSTKFDFTVEDLLDSGVRDYEELNAALIDIDPEYYLRDDEEDPKDHKVR